MPRPGRWSAVWDEAVQAIGESQTTHEAAKRITAIRGVPTEWASIASEWRRRAAAGVVSGSALEHLASCGRSKQVSRMVEELERQNEEYRNCLQAMWRVLYSRGDYDNAALITEVLHNE